MLAVAEEVQTLQDLLPEELVAEEAVQMERPEQGLMALQIPEVVAEEDLVVALVEQAVQE